MEMDKRSWAKGGTRETGERRRGIGDKQRGNGLDRGTGKEFNCGTGNSETMEQWNGITGIPIWGTTGRNNHAQKRGN